MRYFDPRSKSVSRLRAEDLSLSELIFAYAPWIWLGWCGEPPGAPHDAFRMDHGGDAGELER